MFLEPETLRWPPEPETLRRPPELEVQGYLEWTPELETLGHLRWPPELETFDLDILIIPVVHRGPV